VRQFCRPVLHPVRNRGVIQWTDQSSAPATDGRATAKRVAPTSRPAAIRARRSGRLSLRCVRRTAQRGCRCLAARRREVVITATDGLTSTRPTGPDHTKPMSTRTFKRLICGIVLPSLCLGVPRDVEAADPPHVVVFEKGSDGYNVFRIPAIVRAANGDLLAFCEARSGGDASEIDLVMKRSSDSGATWGSLQVVE